MVSILCPISHGKLRSQEFGPLLKMMDEATVRAGTSEYALVHHGYRQLSRALIHRTLSSSPVKQRLRVQYGRTSKFISSLTLAQYSAQIARIMSRLLNLPKIFMVLSVGILGLDCLDLNPRVVCPNR